MADLRENLGWIIGSAVAGVVAFLSWFYESGLLSALVGIAIGAGIAFFVQTKTQNRAWKREYAVKIAETVYGNLFKQIKSIIPNLEEKYSIHYVEFSQWKEFQQDHRYFMVDEKFRVRLDDFARKLEEYSTAAIKLGSEIRKIIMEETERVFGIKTSQIPQAYITYMKGYSRVSTTADPVQCLVSETHPLDFPKRFDPEVTDIAFTLAVASIDNKLTNIPYSSDFDGFWQACIRRMKENETYKFVIKENGKMLEDAQKLKKEITERIEEPWRI